MRKYREVKIKQSLNLSMNITFQRYIIGTDIYGQTYNLII